MVESSGSREPQRRNVARSGRRWCTYTDQLLKRVRICARPFLQLWAHVRGARPYGPVFAHAGVEAQEGRREGARLICIHRGSTFTCQSNSNPPPTLPSTDGHPSAPSRHTRTHSPPRHTHTHTQGRKISFPTLSEMSWDLRCKMECLKHMIRNRQGSH